MQRMADVESSRSTGLSATGKFKFMGLSFIIRKVRKAKYDLDQNDLKPYLQLEKLREGMFGLLVKFSI
jgi:peptidyl-dipeptidase Dcp